MKNICLSTLIYFTLFSGGALIAQDRDTLVSINNLKKREMQILMQQWSSTDNSAGMGFNSVNSGSFTTMGVYRSVGDFHRAQEGSAINGLQFKTERFDKFNKRLFMKGSFMFTTDKEYDRAWSDVFHTYNSSPYIYGSSVKGNYETQRFDLNLRVYTATCGKFNYGVELDYKVADMSRQRDPRSRSYLLDFALIPSITYSFNKSNIIGISGKYRFEKEKMPGLTTVQTNPNLKYYDFTGLEHVDGKIGGYLGFQRQMVSDCFGAAIQYNYKSTGTKFLISLGLDYQKQDVLGNKKQSPGSYNSYNYNLIYDLIFSSNKFLHNLKVKGEIVDGGADEYRQTLESYRNPQTGEITEAWITTYKYINRFVVKTSDVSVNYNLYAKPNADNGYKWSIGATASYNEFKNNYYLPNSEYNVAKIYCGISGACSIYNKNDKSLDINFKALMGYPTKTNLTLASQSELVSAILEPDLSFHKMKTMDLGGDLRYTFPLKFGRSKMYGYAKIYAGNVFAEESMKWFSTGVSIGLLTL